MWQEQTFEERCQQEHQVGDQVIFYQGSVLEQEVTIYQVDKLADGPYVYKIEVNGERWPWDFFGDRLDKPFLASPHDGRHSF